MSEQITDLIESVMPGPRGQQGPEGPRGLPGINAVPADEAVAAYITARDSKTYQALNAPRLLLAFGDSITVGQQSGITDNWVSQLAETLNLRVRSYAVNGAAFYGRRNSGGIASISDQADAMLGDDSLDRGDVALIVVGGGFNDAHDAVATPDAAKEGAAAWLGKIRSAFPLTPVLAVVGLGCPDYPGHTLLSSALPYYHSIGSAFDEDLAQVAYGWQFLYGYGEAYWLRQWDNSPYDAHPSQAGHDVIASRLVQLLRGGQQLTMPTPEQSQTFVASDESTHRKWIIDPQARLFSMLTPENITVTLTPLEGLGSRLHVTMEWHALDNTGGQPVVFGYMPSNRWLATRLSRTVTACAVGDGGTITFPVTLDVNYGTIFISVPAHGTDQAMQDATTLIDITIDYQAGS